MATVTSAVAGRPVVIETATERRIDGHWRRIDHEGLTAHVDGRDVTVDWNDVVAVTLPSRARRPAPPRIVAFLSNGDRLGLRAVTADEEALQARWHAVADSELIAIPLETVRGVAWGLPRNPRRRDQIAGGLRDDESTEGDVATLAEGDRISGSYLGLGADALTLEIAGRETALPVASLRTVRFDPSLAAFPKPPPRRLLIRLRDGSLLTASRLVSEGETITVSAVYGKDVTLPLAVLESVRVLGGSAVSLSDREPVEATQTSLVGESRPLRRDRSVVDTPLRLGSRSFAKGLGVHATSRVTYAIDDDVTEFRAVIGIDATSGRGGSAVFVVELDDREVFRSKTVRGGDSPVDIAVDVRNGRRLALVVEPADRGDVLDRANWCNARLIRR